MGDMQNTAGRSEHRNMRQFILGIAHVLRIDTFDQKSSNLSVEQTNCVVVHAVQFPLVEPKEMLTLLVINNMVMRAKIHTENHAADLAYVAEVLLGGYIKRYIESIETYK